MGFLSPLLLLAGLVLAVPLALHLLHRQRARRIVFPALRYLERTERESARAIRMRQRLLLLVRCLIVVLVTLAAARWFVRGRGTAHAATAVAIILDNSLSSGRVLGAERVLDRLKDLALSGLEVADAEDRIWILRAGEPWNVPAPEAPAAARARVDGTEVSAARGDLTDALRRATALLASSPLPSREIHLLSDLQASAFGPDTMGHGVATVTFTGLPGPEPNRWVRELSLAGGLAPVAGRRVDATVRLGGEIGDSSALPVRLVLDGRVRGAVSLRAGEVAVLPVGPFPLGWVQGYAEAESDALRADDRRWVAAVVHPVPTVAVEGEPGPFVRATLAVLAEAGRIELATSDSPGIEVASAGASDAGTAPRRMILPPADPVRLPALNRWLADAGIGWRYGLPQDRGEARVAASALPVPLDGVRIARHYSLTRSRTYAAPGQVLVALADGDPWVVSTPGIHGEVLLLGSPLAASWTTLPLGAAMVPLLEWALSAWGLSASAPPTAAGDPLSLPGRATDLELPDGTRVAVDPGLEFRATRLAGIYSVLRDDSVLERRAVNPPLRESRLQPLDPGELPRRVGDGFVPVRDATHWQASVFRERSGREPWRALLLTALLLLGLESWMAAAGTRERGRPSPTRPAPGEYGAADA